MKNELKRMQDELDKLRGAPTDAADTTETVPPPQSVQVCAGRLDARPECLPSVH